MTAKWVGGDAAGAAQGFTTKANSEASRNGNDVVIWWLEQGTALRAAGDYRASNDAFSRAEERIDQHQLAAKVQLGQEGVALLSSQASLPYTGRTYDGIMLNTYKALNHLQLGELENARPQLVRAYQRQQDAVAENARLIEKQQKAQELERQNELVGQMREDGPFAEKVNGLSSGLEQMQTYADFVNPFTVFLDGLYFAYAGVDGSDIERARKSFERVMAFSGNNRYVTEELATIEAMVGAKPVAPTTYVILETGSAPYRDQLRIDIPTLWPKLPYLGAAFPRLITVPSYTPALDVFTDLGTNSTALIGSLDGVVAQHFKAELPVVIAKTLISTAVKATATRLAWEATRKTLPDGQKDDGGMTGGLVIMAAVAGQFAVNNADLRTWTTLPKEFQYCRFPTPANRKIALGPRNGQPASTVDLADGVINVVYVRSVSPQSPLVVSQFKLK
jgi:hypothetical protein